MREGVSQTLMDVGREIASIFDNVVSSWGDSSLGDFLGNQEKVKALVESHNWIHNGAARRIGCSSLHGEEASIDSLADNNKGNAGLVRVAVSTLPVQQSAHLVASFLQSN